MAIRLQVVEARAFQKTHNYKQQAQRRTLCRVQLLVAVGKRFHTTKREVLLCAVRRRSASMWPCVVSTGPSSARTITIYYRTVVILLYS